MTYEPPVPIGQWNTDAPLTREQFDEDRPILQGLAISADGVVLMRAEVYVNGRLYRWERYGTTYGSGPEWSVPR